MAFSWLRFRDSANNAQDVSAAQPLPTILSNGTQAADTIAGDSGQNALLVAPNRKEVSFSTTIVAAVGTTDVSNYRWVAVQVTSQGGSSTVTFQCSNDNANWVTTTLGLSTNTGGAVATGAVTTTGVWVGAILARYFRLNVTGIASGTTAGVIEFFSEGGGMTAPAVTVGAVTSSVTPGTAAGNLGKAEDAGHTTGDTGVLILGVRNDTLASQTNTDLDYGAPALDATGSQFVNNRLYDGAAWQLARGSVEGTALTSAARTSTTSSADIVNYNGRGIILHVNITAVVSTPNFTISIDEKDVVSGNYIAMTAYTALAPVGADGYLLTLYPGGAETAATAKHEVQALALPRTFRVTATHNNANSCTYSIGYVIVR